jgi:hypothetical protein
MQQPRLAYLLNPLTSDGGTSLLMDVFRESVRDRSYSVTATRALAIASRKP